MYGSSSVLSLDRHAGLKPCPMYSRRDTTTTETQNSLRRLTAWIATRTLGREFIEYQMRPYIFCFLLLIGLEHIGFGLYFFFEAVALSSTPTEAIDTAIAYTVVNAVLLSVYFGAIWVYSTVMRKSTYDKLNIEVVRNVWSLHGSMLMITLTVGIYLWFNYARQHSVEDQARDEFYVGPVPTHSMLMFAAFIAEMVLILTFVRRLWFTLSRSYAPALLAKEVETLHSEKQVPV